MRRRFLKSRGMPNNKIYYLTSDMQKITVLVKPSVGDTTSDYGFGSPMVSNEFDGEKFVITCLSNITQIGQISFAYNTNLINIQIPNSVTSIGESAFRGCTNLTSIEIPNNVTSIEDSVCQYCTSLTSVVIGNSVTNIGEMTFYNCPNLSSVYVKAITPPTLDESAFINNAPDRKIYVPRASLNAYKTASKWNIYAGAIEPYDF